MTMLLVAENVSFGYPDKQVLNNVSLTVRKGEIISLLGPNGSGKTTLLKTLLGFNQLVKGRVLFEGHAITSLRRADTARRAGPFWRCLTRGP